jgi:hypothetical protein
VVTAHQLTDLGVAGVLITITRADGVCANYFLLNDDHPGARNGAAPGGEVVAATEAGSTASRAGTC